MRIAIDRDKCIGIGICEGLAPGAFEIREDGTLAVTPDLDPAENKAVEGAVAACPTAALQLLES